MFDFFLFYLHVFGFTGTFTFYDIAFKYPTQQLNTPTVIWATSWENLFMT